MVLVENQTVQEALSFTKNAKGKYVGEKNDDIIMSCVNLISYYETDDMREQVDEIFEKMPKSFKDLVAKKLNRPITTEDGEDDFYADILA